jgi:hypothetical protein
MSNIAEESLKLTKMYVSSENKSAWSEVVSMSTCLFFAIYTLLLITDGYYFLVFLVLGFGLGAFYFNNKDGNFKVEHYERNLSYSEQALEQVK